MGVRKTQASTAVLHVDGTQAIAMLSDNINNLRDDMKRGFDQQRDGLVKMFDLFTQHTKEDAKNFEEIKMAASGAAGEARAKSEASAKKSTLWMIGVTALAGVPGIDMMIRWFHK